MISFCRGGTLGIGCLLITGGFMLLGLLRVFSSLLAVVLRLVITPAESCQGQGCKQDG